MAVIPKFVGERIKRREDPRLIQGRATYVDDVALVGMRHVAFKRSDVAHARIRSIDTSVAERILSGSEGTAPAVSVAVDSSMRDLLIEHPKDLSDRIHFMGAQSDADFLAGMAICDAVVFPYVEVGQSSSGVIAQAVELGCRVIASRTRAFLEFAKYHPQTIEFFDIGNHLGFAERLMSRRQQPAKMVPDFNTEANRAIYLIANSGRSPARAERESADLASLEQAAD